MGCFALFVVVVVFWVVGVVVVCCVFLGLVCLRVFLTEGRGCGFFGCFGVFLFVVVLR